MPRVITPEEREARTAKARRLAAVVSPLVAPIMETHLPGCGEAQGRLAGRLVRELPEAARLTAAALAGTRPPSPHTWNVVAQIIAGRYEHQPTAVQPNPEEPTP